MTTGKEAEGVDAVIWIDEDDVVTRGGVKDGISGWWDGEGASTFDEGTAEEDYDNWAQG